MATSKKTTQWERAEQQNLVAWFRLAYPGEIMFSIPNELVRTPAMAARSKLGGLVPGMPDLCVAAMRSRFGGCYIELKRADGKGVLSPEQKVMLERLTEKGYKAVMVTGWDEGREVIIDYMQS